MHLLCQSRASAPPAAHVVDPHALSLPRKRRLNRASRGLNGQSFDGASRRLNSQFVAAAGTAAPDPGSFVGYTQAPALATCRSVASLPGTTLSPALLVCPVEHRELGSIFWSSSTVAPFKRCQGQQRGAPPARPNPSLKRSANGRPPGPDRRYGVHFRQPGPGVLPSSPA